MIQPQVGGPRDQGLAQGAGVEECRRGSALGGSRLLAAVAICLLITLAALNGLARSFSTFLDYDDEGYVLLSVREVLAGNALYDQVYSQYGPAFFGFEWLVHGLLGVPLGHDVSRLQTVAWWILGCVGASILAHRLSGRWPITLSVFALVALHLDRLAAEPGHPQGLALALVLASLLVAESAWAPLWLGSLVAALALVKPNLGLLLALAVAASFASTSRGLRRWVAWAGLGLGIATGLGLAVRHLGRPPWLLLGSSVAVALIAVALVSEGRAPAGRAVGAGGEAGSRWGVGILVLSAAAVTALALALCLAAGTSPRGLVEGLLLQHVGMLIFQFPPPIPIGLGAASLVVGVLLVWFRRRPRWLLAGRWLFGGGAVVVVLVAHQVDLAVVLESGLQNLGGAGLLLALAPLAWIVAVPPPGQSAVATRRLLALAIPLQLLGAYPLAGTQTAIATLPLLVGAVVVLGDAVATTPAVPRWALAVLALVSVLALAGHTAVVGARWAVLAPLELPGTVGLRLPSDQVIRLRALTTQLEQRCSTFIAYPQARNSLYLWSGVDPPTGFNATLWPLMLNSDQQAAIISALERAPAPCALWQTGAFVFEGPLVQYLERRYDADPLEIDGIRLLFRNSGHQEASP